MIVRCMGGGCSRPSGFPWSRAGRFGWGRFESSGACYTAVGKIQLLDPSMLSDGKRESLRVLARSSTAAHRGVQRAKVLLLAGQGAEIVRLTQHEDPSAATHWSCRSMAKAVGVSPATVQRIWSGRGLKPHLVKTSKVSNDPAFEEKLIDVVGLQLPPENAVMLRMDEKASVRVRPWTASRPRCRKPCASSGHRHGRCAGGRMLDFSRVGVQRTADPVSCARLCHAPGIART